MQHLKRSSFCTSEGLITALPSIYHSSSDGDTCRGGSSAGLELLWCLGSLTESGTAGDGRLCRSLVVVEDLGHQVKSCRWR